MPDGALPDGRRWVVNEYARLSEFRRHLGSSVGGAQTDATDVRLLATLEQVSREFDRETHNPMYLRQMVRYVQWPRPCEPRELLIPPAASLSAVAYRTSTSGSYTTLTVDTDYWLEPHDRVTGEPIRKIVLNPEGSLSAWPVGTDERGVRLTGLFGYAGERVATGATVQSNPLSSSAESVTVSAEHGIDRGEVLWIEDEQVYVTEKPTVTTLTVTRGVNGTTAAAHNQGTAIKRLVIPADVKEGVIERARSLWSGEYRGGGPANDFTQSTESGRELYPRWRSIIRAYRLGSAVV